MARRSSIGAFIHGYAPECDDELEAAERAASVFRQAGLNHESAVKNAVAGGGTAAVSVVGGIACVLASETVIIPILCAAAASGGFGAGWLWADASLDSEEAAEEAMDDAADDLAKAEEALCRCLMKHAQP